MSEPAKPRRVLPQPQERIWGSTHLEPWFPNSTRTIGEVWFPVPESALLVKFLFASQNLSVQVHPDDSLAQALGHPRGKTEMWHILRAEPDAKIALGFQSSITPEQVRRSALDGSIMGLLRWIPVHAGQTWFVPAGAVHAIGAGVTLCEIQQNSDLTYRLYDYGRGRDLHMEESLRALNLSFVPQPPQTGLGLQVDCPYFRVSRLQIHGSVSTEPASLTIALDGAGEIEGMPFHPAEVFETAGAGPLRIVAEASLLTVATRT